eukprot:3844407-Amphidinium_carterae.1
MQDIVAGEVESVIQRGIKDTKAKRSWTAEVIRDMKKGILEQIENIESLETLQPKREVKAAYRNLEFKLHVASYQEQVDIVCASVVRGWLVDAGKVKSLVGEDLVCKADGDVAAKKFEDGMEKNAEAARKYLKTLVAKDEKKNFEHYKAFEAAVDANVKTLCNIDKDAVVDMALIAHLGGEGGLKAVQQEFVQKCSPIGDGSRTLAMAVAAGKQLMKSDLYAMMGEGIQLQVKTMQEALESLAKSVTPKRPSVLSTWQQSFWLSLPQFYKCASSGSSGSRKEVGMAAFEKDVALLQTQERKDVKVLEGLECWSPFMGSEMVQSLDELRKSSNAGAKKRTMKAAAEAKPSGSKSQPTAQESAEQAVMAMLKRR